MEFSLHTLPSTRALRAFEASARHLSFRQAAQELAVTQAAVAQLVRQLEADLGVPLFERQVRGLALTQAGRSYQAPIRQALEMIAQATRALGERADSVTLSVTPSFAAKWLLPRLPAFVQAHPDIDLRVQASDRLASFSDDVDLAVRLGEPPFGAHLIAEKLQEQALVAVGGPAVLPNRVKALTPRQLFSQTLLCDAHDAWPVFAQDILGEALPPLVRRLSFNQTSLAIDAAMAGQGIALVPACFVTTDLAAGRLQQVIVQAWRGTRHFYVVQPRGVVLRPAVAAVRQWLFAQALA